jgi:molybdopterin-guanine dinucleotide biosynthesis protein B
VQRLGPEELTRGQSGQPEARPVTRPRLFGVAGYKNAGKTTLIVELLRELVSRGWRVGTVKHAHHDFDIDQPGKDSYLHRAAGALEVVVASARRVAHIRELAGEAEPGLDELVSRMGDLDLVLVEGWKSGSHPRLELRREAVPAPPIAGRSPGVVAVVSDGALPAETLPVLARGNVPVIADFVLAAVGLPQLPTPARPQA